MKTLCTLIFSSTCSLCRVESGLGLMGLGNMDIKIQSVCNIVAQIIRDYTLFNIHICSVGIKSFNMHRSASQQVKA